MVLDDVTGRADAVVVARPAADPDVLRHRDLHVVDEAAVPDRLVERVGEAQREDVLDRLLAQVVVDPEHRLGREDLVHDRVQLLRRFQVAAERLLDDDPPPRRVPARGGRAGVGQPGPLELLHHGGEELRRDRQVERVVPAGARARRRAGARSRPAGRTPRRR